MKWPSYCPLSTDKVGEAQIGKAEHKLTMADPVFLFVATGLQRLMA